MRWREKADLDRNLIHRRHALEQYLNRPFDPLLDEQRVRRKAFTLTADLDEVMQAETCRIRQFGDRDAVGEAFVHEFEHNAPCLRSKTAGACLLVSVLFNNELRDSGDCLPQLRVGAVERGGNQCLHGASQQISSEGPVYCALCPTCCCEFGAEQELECVCSSYDTYPFGPLCKRCDDASGSQQFVRRCPFVAFSAQDVTG
jgi:hypothetical protein